MVHLGLFGWLDNLVQWLQRVFGHDDHATRGIPPVYDPLNLPPVPEPSTWLLMLAGVVLVVLVARRQKRRQQGRHLNLFDTHWMRNK